MSRQMSKINKDDELERARANHKTEITELLSVIEQLRKENQQLSEKQEQPKDKASQPKAKRPPVSNLSRKLLSPQSSNSEIFQFSSKLIFIRGTTWQ